MNNASVKIYILNYCPFCMQALDLIKNNFNNQPEIIDITDDLGLKEQIKKENNFTTFPQIFINNKFIGGFDDLEKYLHENQ